MRDRVAVVHRSERGRSVRRTGGRLADISGREADDKKDIDASPLFPPDESIGSDHPPCRPTVTQSPPLFRRVNDCFATAKGSTFLRGLDGRGRRERFPSPLPDIIPFEPT